MFGFSRVVAGNFLFSNKNIIGRDNGSFCSKRQVLPSHLKSNRAQGSRNEGHQCGSRGYDGWRSNSSNEGQRSWSILLLIIPWCFDSFSTFFFSPKLSKKYGPIYTIHMGPKKVVVLSGYETVKDALINYGNQFGERSRVPIFERLFDGKGKDP